MVRTDIVNLTVIKAIAFRQKLMAGGSGVTILRYDFKQPGIASISKTSGQAIPAANTPLESYPLEAFNEAIKLTAGSQIGRVTDIWLTAYVCASLDDFDAERNYIGDTSCTIHIVKG